MHTKAVFSPYGAFEMKASYQRNMLTGNLVVLSIVSTIVLVLWFVSLFDRPKDIVIKDNDGVIDWTNNNPLTPINAEKLRPRGQKPKIQVRSGGIPIPIPDNEFPDEEIPILISRDIPVETNGVGVDSIDFESTGGRFGYINGGGDSTIYPGETEFVPFEKEPEMYYYKEPAYPRLCKLAGIEGKVIIKVLVGIDGLVKKALVAISSGNESLDQAALVAAKENQFSPALQNSIPIALWVSYTVTFTLD